LVFSSILFLYLFFPILLITYFVIKNQTYRNWVLIVFSFVFYAWGEPVWIILLLLASTAGYLFALAIEKYRGTGTSKLLFITAICLNIGLLGFFKYSAFFVENLNFVAGLNFPIPDVGLPIGISFFTFEIICYLTDVYKGTIRAPRSPMQMFLYVSFFPHLIAGPIIRFSDIEQQIKSRVITVSGFSQGINRFIIGLGKKVIIANLLGETVPLLLDGPQGADSFLGAWFGVCLYALQIYFDFSGYSDMAIGLGLMFGFTLKENFNYPYISKSATEFWRRWNMSLGGFFRDYVYIPLGGNRKHFIRNVFVVWFLTGFWHGSSWNFVIWGLYFGFLIMLERYFLQRFLDKLPRIVSHLYLTIAMLFGWVWFYFTDLSEALNTFKILLGLADKPFYTTELTIYFKEHMIIFLIAIVASTPLISSFFIRLKERKTVLGSTISWVHPLYNMVILAAATSLLIGSTYNPFLYFRF
jgi:alginate O-acetyltransferase complex protein AlgI